MSNQIYFPALQKIFKLEEENEFIVGNVEGNLANNGRIKYINLLTEIRNDLVSIDKVITIELAAKDIIALNTIPVTLIPTVVGKTINPKSIIVRNNGGTVGWTTGEVLNFQYVSSVSPYAESDNGILTSIIPRILNAVPITQRDMFQGEDFIITSDTDPIGGDVTYTIVIHYSEDDI